MTSPVPHHFQPPTAFKWIFNWQSQRPDNLGFWFKFVRLHCARGNGLFEQPTFAALRVTIWIFAFFFFARFNLGFFLNSLLWRWFSISSNNTSFGKGARARAMVFRLDWRIIKFSYFGFASLSGRGFVLKRFIGLTCVRLFERVLRLSRVWDVGTKSQEGPDSHNKTRTWLWAKFKRSCDANDSLS